MLRVLLSEGLDYKQRISEEGVLLLIRLVRFLLVSIIVPYTPSQSLPDVHHDSPG